MGDDIKKILFLKKVTEAIGTDITDCISQLHVTTTRYQTFEENQVYLAHSLGDSSARLSGSIGLGPW